MTQIPDLMRRFVATPQRVFVSFGKKSIAVESNERSITTSVARYLAANMQLETVRKIQLVRMIRDKDVISDGTRFSCVQSGPIVALLRGTTTSFFLDIALGELLGFLASDVDLKELEQRLLPAILCGTIPSESSQPVGDDKQVTSAASARDNLAHAHN